MEINRAQVSYCNRFCPSILFFCLVLIGRSSLAFSPLTDSVRMNLHPQHEESNTSEVSIITGANGFLGRHIVHQLLQQPKQQQVVCLVRSSRVSSETNYWQSLISKSLDKYNNPVLVMPYDMIDGGVTLENAIRTFKGHPFTVYHTASIFGPTEDPIQTAMHNVQGTEDVVRTIAKFNESCGSNQLVLTSSMAAVRGPGQLPLTGGDRNVFTAQDWNTMSTLGAKSWGKCYQWSKMQSERSAWELSNKLKVTMTSLCPSLIVGPPTFSSFTKDAKLSYSLDLVEGWMKGNSPVQSRLFVDVRDVAAAHIAAAASRESKRYIVSCERRIPAQVIATSLRTILNEHKQQHNLYNPSKIDCDEDFNGGSIPIGEQEVLASDALKTDLGVVCRPVTETFLDMGRELLLMRDKGS